MKSRYPLRPLGDVIHLDRDEVPVESTVSYRLAGMYSFGRGVLEREPMNGSEMSYRSLFRLHEGTLVMSRLNAWEGAVAVVTGEHDGCFVSNEYPTFSIDQSQALPSYLALLCSWPQLWEALRERARGMGSDVGARRLRVHPDELLATEVPLPDIEEQRRVTDWLRDILDRGARIRHAMERARPICGATVPAWLQQAMIDCAGPLHSLGELGEVRRGRGPRYAEGSGCLTLNQACVRDGTVDLSACREVEVDWWQQVPSEGRVRSGDVLVNSTGEGTIGRSALAPIDAIGMPFDSHVLAFTPDESRLLPGFCAAFLRSPVGQTAIEAVKGASTTKQTELGKNKLEALQMAVPPISSQEKIVQELGELEALVARLETSTAHRKSLVDALPIAAMRHAFAGLTS